MEEDMRGKMYYSVAASVLYLLPEQELRKWRAVQIFYFSRDLMTSKVHQAYQRTLNFLKLNLDFVPCKKTHLTCLFQHEAGQSFQTTW